MKTEIYKTEFPIGMNTNSGIHFHNCLVNNTMKWAETCTGLFLYIQCIYLDSYNGCSIETFYQTYMQSLNQIDILFLCCICCCWHVGMEWERAKRLQEKMRTNLDMAKERIDLLSKYRKYSSCSSVCYAWYSYHCHCHCHCHCHWTSSPALQSDMVFYIFIILYFN